MQIDGGPHLSLSDLPEIVFVLDGELRVVRLNAAAAAALGLGEGGELGAARAPFDRLVQPPGDRRGAAVPSRAMLRDPSTGRELCATATALGDGTTLVLLLDVSTALDRPMQDLAGGFVHELRNVGFGLVVMADMLAGNPANQEALRHARASIARLTAATDTLQELAQTSSAPTEELDVATIVDAAAERAWPPGSTRRLVRTGLSPCFAWGQPELLARAVGVVLEDVAQHAPKADVIAAEVRRSPHTDPSMVQVAVRARGDDLPLRDPAKIDWDALVTRRDGRLTPGLGLARRWVRPQGGRLGARHAPDGSVEMMVEVPAGRRADGGP